MDTKAEQLVRSVLSEAYTGAVAAVLRGYRLLDEKGDLRVVTTGPNVYRNRLEEVGPILDPKVIEKFLELDSSKKKLLFKWMLYAAAGGEPALEISRQVLEKAKDAMIQQRTGTIIDRVTGNASPPVDQNGKVIPPLTKEEAEAEWETTCHSLYYETYFFGDEDVASDWSYPCFGWYRHWPGRDGIYATVLSTVRRAKLLLESTDKAFLEEWNKRQATQPALQISSRLFDMWNGDKPRYSKVEDYLTYIEHIVYSVAKFKEGVIKAREVLNVKELGIGTEGGYRVSSDEVFYEDDNLAAYVPLTAPAALKRGIAKWCVSNSTEWDRHFAPVPPGGDIPIWRWGQHAELGPFCFVHLKEKCKEWKLNSLALHLLLLRKDPELSINIDVWDADDKKHSGDETIYWLRLEGMPKAAKSLAKVIREFSAWVDTVRDATVRNKILELNPKMESLARALAANLLDD